MISPWRSMKVDLPWCSIKSTINQAWISSPIWSRTKVYPSNWSVFCCSSISTLLVLTLITRRASSPVIELDTSDQTRSWVLERPANWLSSLKVTTTTTTNHNSDCDHPFLRSCPASVALLCLIQVSVTKSKGFAFVSPDTLLEFQPDLIERKTFFVYLFARASNRGQRGQRRQITDQTDKTHLKQPAYYHLIV